MLLFRARLTFTTTSSYAKPEEDQQATVNSFGEGRVRIRCV